MNTLLTEFDLITAERISGYLKQRIHKLQEYKLQEREERSAAHHLSYRPSHMYALLIQELRELKIHIDGDLNSMLNDMEARS